MRISAALLSVQGGPLAFGQSGGVTEKLAVALQPVRGALTIHCLGLTGPEKSELRLLKLLEAVIMHPKSQSRLLIERRHG